MLWIRLKDQRIHTSAQPECSLGGVRLGLLELRLLLRPHRKRPTGLAFAYRSRVIVLLSLR